MTTEPNTPTFQDPENYGGEGAPLDYPSIVMAQLSRVTVLGSQEMRAGYTREIPVSVGGGASMMRTEYIPDSRAAYMGAVKILEKLLLPYQDEEFENDVKVIREWIAQKDNTDENLLESRHRLLQALCLLLKRRNFLGEASGESQ